MSTNRVHEIEAFGRLQMRALDEDEIQTTTIDDAGRSVSVRVHLDELRELVAFVGKDASRKG